MNKHEILILTLIACFISLIAGALFMEKITLDRLRDKCLAEHADRVHKDAVEICKDRLK